VTNEQHRELLTAISDLQATLDAIALDTQVVREHFMGRDAEDADGLEPPAWANQGSPALVGGDDERVATPAETELEREWLRREQDAGLPATALVIAATIVGSGQDAALIMWAIAG
jgi:hypothetical protein